MTESTSLRWGILATGNIASSFMLDANTVGLNVTAVGSRSLVSAQAFAAENGIARAHGSYEELVADEQVDIVYVATPHPWHYPNTMAALDRGKHALVEKPFTLTRPEAEQLAATASERGLLVTEAMWTRYLPHMARIREILAAGGIGEVQSVSATHAQALPTDPEHRLNALELGGGSLLDLGVYPISFAWDILGEPTSIKAVGILGETGADTSVATVMQHASGAVSTSLCSSRSPGANTAHILGTTGRIDIEKTWFTPANFTHYDARGNVVEAYHTQIEGRGMQFQALAAEQFVATGRYEGDLMPLAESVGIMGTLDEIRRQIGVHYPGE